METPRPTKAPEPPAPRPPTTGSPSPSSLHPGLSSPSPTRLTTSFTIPHTSPHHDCHISTFCPVFTFKAYWRVEGRLPRAVLPCSIWPCRRPAPSKQLSVYRGTADSPQHHLALPACLQFPPSPVSSTWICSGHPQEHALSEKSAWGAVDGAHHLIICSSPH